ncbi:MAG: type II toxin-antitoxin system PemK/MazF family toxin [Bryobacteraceae bacterium]|nr:type II toxin-antitoxin system PemK/MazF family toxin [Bryobacteraceae bacterium]
MTQYEIWWANLAPPAGGRPVLLLSRPSAYSYLNRLLAAEVTSSVRGIVQEVPLGKAEGLPSACAANFDNIRTVPRSALAKRIGKLPSSREIEVRRALGMSLGWEELI